MFKKILTIVAVLFLFTVEVFSQEWSICLGSFKNFQNAETRVELLKKEGISTNIQEYKKNDNETFYRVIYSETSLTRIHAEKAKEILENHPTIKKLGINDIWFIRQTENKTKEKSVEKNIISPVVKSEVEKAEIQPNNLSVAQQKEEILENPEEEQILKNDDKIEEVQLFEPAAEELEDNTPEEEPIIESDDEIVEVQLLEVPMEEIEEEIPEEEPVVEQEEEIITTEQETNPNKEEVVISEPIIENIETKSNNGEIVKEEEILVVVLLVNEVKDNDKKPEEEVVPLEEELENTEPLRTVNQIKIVLDWGELPWDLDAHILDKDNHVYYYSKEQNNLTLDKDERKSYGPEIITIDNPAPDSVYKYYVHDYTNDYNDNSDKLSYSNVEVKVYFDDELEASFKINPNQEGFSWYVFDIAEGYKIIKKDIVSSKNYIEF